MGSSGESATFSTPCYIRRPPIEGAPLPMARVAEMLANPPPGGWCDELETPSGAIYIAEYPSILASRFEIGVPRVQAWLQAIGEDPLEQPIFIEVRPHPTVRWDQVFTVLVDGAEIQVRDTSLDPADGRPIRRPENASVWYPSFVEDHMLLTLGTGADGIYAGVVGVDAAGGVSGIVVGPAVEPEDFGFDWVEP